MAISHNARYCNGFPTFFSNTEVLWRSIQSTYSRSFLSIAVLSGHKSSHIFSGLHDNELKQKDDANNDIAQYQGITEPGATRGTGVNRDNFFTIGPYTNSRCRHKARS
jgi:hypothetical protein